MKAEASVGVVSMSAFALVQILVALLLYYHQSVTSYENHPFLPNNLDRSSRQYITILQNHILNQTVLLVGTVHGSNASLKVVRDVIRYNKPDVVMVELHSTQFKEIAARNLFINNAILMNKIKLAFPAEEWEEPMSSQSTQSPITSKINTTNTTMSYEGFRLFDFKVLRPIASYISLLLQQVRVLLKVQRILFLMMTEQLRYLFHILFDDRFRGTSIPSYSKSGDEFEEAIVEAIHVNSTLLLGDRDAMITFERIWGALINHADKRFAADSILNAYLKTRLTPVSGH